MQITQKHTHGIGRHSPRETARMECSNGRKAQQLGRSKEGWKAQQEERETSGQEAEGAQARVGG